jgi:hypothetical protein
MCATIISCSNSESTISKLSLSWACKTEEEQDMNPILTTNDYQIVHATGELRRAGQALLHEHYMGSAGGSGYLYAVVDAGGVVQGACLIGPSSSMAAERSLVSPPWRIWCVKRLFARDTCTIPESQLLRASLRHTADLRGETLIVCAYADPVATDSRTGLPLTGKLYLSAGFMFVGETSQPRYAVIDDYGRARSTRQGKQTLTRRTLPHGWSMIRVPPARIWLAVVPPTLVRGPDGTASSTTQRWRKKQWRTAWAALTPQRRVAAQQWVSEKQWRRLLRSGIIPIGEPKPHHIQPHRRLQPAYWEGHALTRTAGPVWVPFLWQQQFLSEDLLEGERTAGRNYQPRLLAARAS